jgi:hypothetical protein
MMTPETNTAVLLKLQELQPYIPLLARMIDKLNRAGATGGDDKARTDQLTKLNSLYSVIHNKNMKVPLQTLEKCHTALRKLFEKDTPSKFYKIQVVLLNKEVLGGPKSALIREVSLHVMLRYFKQ